MRRWTRVLLVVIAAAACSLASAVIPVLIDPYLPQPESTAVRDVERLPFTPNDFPTGNVMWIKSRPGLLRETTIRGIGIEDSWHVDRLSAGWPVRMLEGGDYYEFHNTGGKPATATMHPSWLYQRYSGGRQWRFPTRPIPLAVAVNLGFWLLICGAVAWAVPAIRRRLRRRKHRCEACGYPMPVTGLCPECGTARA